MTKLNKFQKLLMILMSGFLLGMLGLGISPSHATAASIQLQDNPPATPLPDPLGDPLPEAGPIPESAWRPALFPVPWSLSDYDHFFLTRPITARSVNWPLQVYRYGGTNFGPNLPHTGVDIVTKVGTPAIATGPGTIVWTGSGLYSGGNDPNDPYGISVVIEHDFGYIDQPLFSVYAHLSQSLVQRGQHVETGEVIAYSGDTGNVTSAHLHYEIRLGVNDYYHSMNPELWMAPPQGWGVLAGRLTTTWNNLVDGLEIRITNRITGQRWYAKAYGSTDVINGDPYYHENFVLSDLPAGHYEIYVPYVGYGFYENVWVYPGAVTYFTFRGMNGVFTQRPLRDIPESVPNYLELVPGQ
ncbi:MAG: M23 family metallopeptidase [Chloroflexota bacterium]